MTEKKQSRLQPQIPYWYEDLPLRDAPLDPDDPSDQPKLYIDALRMDDNVLELSREGEFQRGTGLMAGIVVLLASVFLIWIFFLTYSRAFDEVPILVVAAPFFAVALLTLSIFL